MAKEIHICDHCGQKYETYSHDSHFCSRKCCDAHRHDKRLRTHICEVCGKSFSDYWDNSKYCSRDCYFESKRHNPKLKTIPCPICGKMFKQRNSDHKYCCKKCAGVAQRNRVDCVCVYCGKTFQVKASDAYGTRMRYCSTQCRNADTKWSATDTEILRELYGKMKYSEMCGMFSVPRSVDEIARRAQNIGITKSRRWSKKETEILQQSYPTVPMDEVLELLPEHSISSIVGKAGTMGLKSYFFLTHRYDSNDDEYLRHHYLDMSNDEISEVLHRTPDAIGQRLCKMGLYRPTDIDKYQDIKKYVRSRLYPWRNKYIASCHHKCALTGQGDNLVVHHIRGFTLIFDEAVEVLNFPVREKLSDYQQSEIDVLVQTVIAIQESYKQYICIAESIHKEFHSLYGYGNNTPEQWDEFVRDRYA